MSQSLANLGITLPLSSKGGNSSVPMCRSRTGRKLCNNRTIKVKAMKGEGKAMKGEGRDNLDHLQMTSKHHHQIPSPPPKQRMAPVAPIGLWDRFPTARTVQQMLETMDRLMEDPFAYGGSWPSPLPAEAGGLGRGRTPWEIKEGETAYKMRFDMPGMTKDDVKVWVEEKMLVVKAEKVPKKKGQDAEESINGGVGGEEDWSAKSYGRYSSRIALPENVQFEKIKAEVKDGILYITIPKASYGGKILDISVQ
ncbi:Alpha crystallin/Hsp20 domain [Dillenia turbinata]|uniref:Alpha crystallin/Hsp20 domain n=1 Tax=Dillenia turbinata TaxID=194707 RepID=A0AAN8Z0X6_9MAGN